MKDSLHIIWEFIRGDMTSDVFEQWVYQTPELETQLGKTAYFKLISSDYRDRNKVWEIKNMLREAIAKVSPRTCDCLSWKNNEILPLGDSHVQNLISGYFKKIWRRTPWLSLSRCNQCGQQWYVGVDTIDDNYYLYRMENEDILRVESNEWPHVFDNISAFWPDQFWLQRNGYLSLEDWINRNNPKS